MKIADLTAATYETACGPCRIVIRAGAEEVRTLDELCGDIALGIPDVRNTLVVKCPKCGGTRRVIGLPVRWDPPLIWRDA